jgi:hypothetical protein
MANKGKRQVRKEKSEKSVSTAASSPTSNRPTDFNPDYSYVLRDLKRVGILAGAFLVILMVLSFLI